jgi:hypothetical protein
MTRNRKADPAVLEREYIYDAGSPPVSLTELADKYGMARSGIAEKARAGRWYERRVEFRKQLGERVVAELGEAWVARETAQREAILQLGIDYIEKYREALDDGTIKVTTRDMLGVAAMVRTFMSDVAAGASREEGLIDPENVDLPPEDLARHALRVIEEQERAELGDGLDGAEPGYADGPEATTAAGLG